MAAGAEVPKHLVGTAQYPDAGDLSSYLAHLTWTGEALASILTDGRIEARKAFGLAGQNPQHAETHKAVCLTEAPASELTRFQDRRYGVAFTREFVQRLGGQRVWYIDHGAPLWYAFTHEVNRLRDISENTRFFEMTPFIDMVRPGTYAYDWEREWRVVGDLRFEWEDVAYVITPEEGLLTFEDQPAVGSGGYNPKDAGYEWSGGTFTELDDAMNLLMQQFHTEFESPEQHLWLDRESEDGFNWNGFKRWETEEAVEHLFKDRPERVREALREHLNDESYAWLSSREYHEMRDYHEGT